MRFSFARVVGTAVVAAAVGAALTVIPFATSAAQSPDITVPVLPQFGAMAGISLPIGSIAKTAAPGFNIGALAQYRAPGEVLGVRAEAIYQHFPAKPNGGSSSSSTALTLNVLYNPPGYDFRPYIIGGMGFYHITDAGNHPGINAGVGIDIPLTGLSAHLESRIHWALTPGRNYITIPLSFGLRF